MRAANKLGDARWESNRWHERRRGCAARVFAHPWTPVQCKGKGRLGHPRGLATSVMVGRRCAVAASPARLGSSRSLGSSASSFHNRSSSQCRLDVTHNRAQRSLSRGRRSPSGRWKPPSELSSRREKAHRNVASTAAELSQIAHLLDIQGSVISRNLGSPSEIASSSPMYSWNPSADSISFSLARASASEVK